MKNVQNKALANTVLSIGGASYTGDHGGVFAMDGAHADMLLATPGWSNSARGPEEAPAAFDPVAAMAGGADAGELQAVKAQLQQALGAADALRTKLRTSESLRADLQLAVKSRDAEIDQLKAAAADADAPADPVAPASAPVPPAPGATSAPATPTAGDGSDEAADDEGPQLDGMDKKQLLAAAEKWEVELTAPQKKLGADKLRPILDKAIYGD
ncbi:MAG: hypothetical protein O7G84_01175 [Gammaproteobacteria bacterium]|nr:hypothetical protein [Gammaproteobacteria bacterium]